MTAAAIFALSCVGTALLTLVPMIWLLVVRGVLGTDD